MNMNVGTGIVDIILINKKMSFNILQLAIIFFNLIQERYDDMYITCMKYRYLKMFYLPAFR